MQTEKLLVTDTFETYSVIMMYISNSFEKSEITGLDPEKLHIYVLTSVKRLWAFYIMLLLDERAASILPASHIYTNILQDEPCYGYA